jgi:hypothetical protein
MADHRLSERYENRLLRQPKPQLALQEPNNKLSLTRTALVLGDINLPATCISRRKQLLDSIHLPALRTIAADSSNTQQPLEHAPNRQPLRLEHGRLRGPRLDSHQTEIANFLLVLLDDSQTPARTLPYRLHDQRLANAQLYAGVVRGQLVDHEQHGGKEIIRREPQHLSQEQRAVLHDDEALGRQLDERERLAQCRVGHRLAGLPVGVRVLGLGCELGLHFLAHLGDDLGLLFFVVFFGFGFGFRGC